MSTAPKLTIRIQWLRNASPNQGDRQVGVDGHPPTFPTRHPRLTQALKLSAAFVSHSSTMKRKRHALHPWRQSACRTLTPEVRCNDGICPCLARVRRATGTNHVPLPGLQGSPGGDARSPTRTASARLEFLLRCACLPIRRASAPAAGAPQLTELPESDLIPRTTYLSRRLGVPPLVAQAAYDAEVPQGAHTVRASASPRARLEVRGRAAVTDGSRYEPYRAHDALLVYGARASRVRLELMPWSTSDTELGLRLLRSARAGTPPSKAYIAAGSALLEDLAALLRQWADEPLRQAVSGSGAAGDALNTDKL